MLSIYPIDQCHDPPTVRKIEVHVQFPGPGNWSWKVPAEVVVVTESEVGRQRVVLEGHPVVVRSSTGEEVKVVVEPGSNQAVVVVEPGLGQYFAVAEVRVLACETFPHHRPSPWEVVVVEVIQMGRKRVMRLPGPAEIPRS